MRTEVVRGPAPGPLRRSCRGFGALACLISTAAACSSATNGPGVPPPPPPPPGGPLAPVVVDVVDIGNAGDAGDIRITFRGRGDDADVVEYRVYVAGEASVGGGDPPTDGAFASVPKAGGEIDARLPAGLADQAGDGVEEGVPYVVYVQAWTGDASMSPVSEVSDPITLASTDIVETIVALDAGTGGVEVDPDGNIYVADFGTQLSGGTAGTSVYRVTPTGEVSVFATGLSGASGNAFDSQGNLLQSNIAASTISRIAPDGTVETLASGGGLAGPVGIAVGAGDTLYVASCNNDTIQRVSPDGAVTEFSSGGLFNCPNGIALADDGNFYVANFGGGNVVRVSPAGAASLLVTLPTNNLGHVTAANGVLYVVSRGTHQIWEVTLAGATRVLAGTGARGRRDGAAPDATLSFPNDIGVSPDGSVLYFNDVDPGTSGTNVISPSWLRALRLEAPDVP